jgi:hypothetical protein
MGMNKDLFLLQLGFLGTLAISKQIKSIYSAIKVCRVIAMGYDLFSANENLTEDQRNYYLSIFSWPMILELAQQYGWKPMGTVQYQQFKEDVTLLYEDHKWSGGYYSNDGQAVVADDAKALADALESALDDIPEYGCFVPKSLTLSSSEEIEGYTEVPNNPVLNKFLKPLSSLGTNLKIPNILLSPIEYFSGERKGMVIDFIKFCRQGLFYIW